MGEQPERVGRAGADIADVARRAGVSTATVSRALRGLPNVAEDTRIRVMAAAAELDYVITPSASRLASGQTHSIGVVVPFLGPSSLRDAPAKIPDSVLGPYLYIDHVPTRNVTRAVNVVDTRASLLSAEKMVSGDKYIFVRNAYLQNREFRVKDGEVVDDF